MNINNVSRFLIGFLFMFHIAAWGLQLGSFTQQPIQAIADAQVSKLAVIDISQESLQWLRTNRIYLEQEQIPVIVLGADMRSMLPLWQEFAGDVGEAELTSLEQAGSDFSASLPEMEQSFPQGGLIIGPEPANPPGLIAAFLEQMGVSYYPVVIDRGIAWQVNPFVSDGLKSTEEQKQ